MKSPEYYSVAANETEREALRNDRTAKFIIFGIIALAFALSSAVMLSIFWKSPPQRNTVAAVLSILFFIGVFWFLRTLRRSNKIRRGAEFLLIYGIVTAKRQSIEGDAAFIAINHQEFLVGPEVFDEARIGARIGVREWSGTGEFYDYTFKTARLDDWLQRGEKL